MPGEADTMKASVEEGSGDAPTTDSGTQTKELDALRKRVAKLSRKEAKYRTERNVALKANAGLAHVVNHHNIKADGSVVNSENLQIVDGKVVGSVVYSPTALPRKRSNPSTSPDGGQGSGLTLNDVKSMTPAQINKRWDEVKTVLATKGN